MPTSVEKARIKRLWDNYGLTVKEWETILEFQRGVCFICGKKQKSGKRLATDHRHNDGQVRGLLCSQCNRLLGRIEATFGNKVIELLPRVTEYLIHPPAVAALARQIFGYAGRTGTKKQRKFLKKRKKEAKPWDRQKLNREKNRRRVTRHGICSVLTEQTEQKEVKAVTPIKPPLAPLERTNDTGNGS